MLTDKQIKEFQKIYFQTYGKKIDEKEALDKGISLICLLQTIYKNLAVKKLYENQDTEKFLMISAKKNV